MGLQCKVLTGVLIMHIGRTLLRAKTLQTGILNVTSTGGIKNSVLTIESSHESLSLRIVEPGDFSLFESDPVGIRRRLPSFILWSSPVSVKKPLFEKFVKFETGGQHQAGVCTNPFTPVIQVI